MISGIHGLTPMATCFRRVRGSPITHAAAEPRQQVAVGVSPWMASRATSNHGSHFVRQAANAATARLALRSRLVIALVAVAAFAANNWRDDIRDPWAHAHGYLLPPRSRLTYHARSGGAATAGSRGRQPMDGILRSRLVIALVAVAAFAANNCHDDIRDPANEKSHKHARRTAHRDKWRSVSRFVACRLVRGDASKTCCGHP